MKQDLKFCVIPVDMDKIYRFIHRSIQHQIQHRAKEDKRTLLAMTNGEVRIICQNFSYTKHSTRPPQGPL